ncbi:hypothetical protein J6590_079448 [Homalodisca vitripennis]|nr:hypothetical protein J6590_079448 [Homalodisca vitripennis]
MLLKLRYKYLLAELLLECVWRLVPTVTGGPTRIKVPSIGPVSSMVLSHVSEDEVVRDVQGLKPKPPCMAAQTMLYANVDSTHIFDQTFFLARHLFSLEHCKKVDLSLASNYRTISILPVISKVFENIF